MWGKWRNRLIKDKIRGQFLILQGKWPFIIRKYKINRKKEMFDKNDIFIEKSSEKCYNILI